MSETLIRMQSTFSGNSDPAGHGIGGLADRSGHPNEISSLTCGPMFAGKTTALISRFHRLSNQWGQERVCVFAPSYDTRYAQGIVSHNKEEIPESSVIRVKNDHEIVRVLREKRPQFILIDEIQFFAPPMFTGDAVRAIHQYIVHNSKEFSHTERCRTEVHYHGLDVDAMGEEFPATRRVREAVEGSGGTVKRIHATCHICGEKAYMTQRLHTSDSSDRYALGGRESYAPVCLRHWTPVA